MSATLTVVQNNGSAPAVATPVADELDKHLAEKAWTPRLANRVERCPRRSMLAMRRPDTKVIVSQFRWTRGGVGPARRTSAMISSARAIGMSHVRAIYRAERPSRASLAARCIKGLGCTPVAGSRGAVATRSSTNLRRYAARVRRAWCTTASQHPTATTSGRMATGPLSDPSVVPVTKTSATATAPATMTIRRDPAPIDAEDMLTCPSETTKCLLDAS
jgi:hypothetical protein